MSPLDFSVQIGRIDFGYVGSIPDADLLKPIVASVTFKLYGRDTTDGQNRVLAIAKRNPTFSISSKDGYTIVEGTKTLRSAVDLYAVGAYAAPLADAVFDFYATLVALLEQ